MDDGLSAGSISVRPVREFPDADLLWAYRLTSRLVERALAGEATHPDQLADMRGHAELYGVELARRGLV